jgi:hypothetical protein
MANHNRHDLIGTFFGRWYLTIRSSSFGVEHTSNSSCSAQQERSETPSGPGLKIVGFSPIYLTIIERLKGRGTTCFPPE